MKKRIVIILAHLILTNIHANTFDHPISNEELFKSKRILVLGGTGFLGRAITQELLKYDPANIVIFSRDEVKHFNTQNFFGNNPKIKYIVGDIRDSNQMLLATKDIDIVFHTAALKRIDMLESNILESIKTNILGSINVLNACIENNVKKLVFISTDKACSPINVYGACKFVSEKVFTNQTIPSSLTCVVARYGNVLESTGSVIPIFLEKIKNNEDIPLTDDRMTRFIISKDQAVELIFDALRYGVGGEIFVKALPSFKVVDLIDVLKDRFNATLNVYTIGLRPGEKLHELLINKIEASRTIKFKDLFIIRPTISHAQDTKHLPLYLKEGKPLQQSEHQNYSSKNTVINQQEIQALFNKLNILQ